MESYMLLTEGYDFGGVIVSAASSRLRIAFDTLLKHPRMLKQRRRIEDHLKMKSLNDERNTSLNTKTDLIKERQNYTSELTNLVTNAEKWKGEIGEEAYMKRKRRVVENEGEVEGKLKIIDEKIQRLDEDIQRLTKKAKRDVPVLGNPVFLAK